MTTTQNPQTMTTPAEIAARTALANAGMGKSNMDHNLFTLAMDFCTGEAEFFGEPVTTSKGRHYLVQLFAGFLVDADAMETHYLALCAREAAAEEEREDYWHNILDD